MRSSDADDPGAGGARGLPSVEYGDALWRKFDGSPPIPGFLTNIFAILRETFVSDKAVEGEFSPSCDFTFNDESNFAREVCEYLLKNGIKQVQMLSNYVNSASAAAETLLDKGEELGVSVEMDPSFIPSEDENTIDVSVVLLIHFNGRLPQLKMYELIREAYQTSRLGVIIIGSPSLFDYIFEEKWGSFISHLRRENRCKDYLEIYCRHHNVVNRSIFSADDLKKHSPFGGCNTFCGEMSCGHYCEHPCHPMDPDHSSEKYRCWRQCKRVCPLGHRCLEVCWKDCGNCYYVLAFPKTCKHDGGQPRQIFCYMQPTEKCLVSVIKQLTCGHYVTTTCSTNVDKLQCQQLLKGNFTCGHEFIFRCDEDVREATCQVLVMKKFDCGHEKQIPCVENTTLGDNLRCVNSCNKELNCGHTCDRPCHLDDPNHENFQCQQPCAKYCARGVHRCSQLGKHPCWQPCDPCMEEYSFQLPCFHYVPLTCSIENPGLDTYVCTKKCTRGFTFCRHKCTKKCGEDCGVCEARVLKRTEECRRGHQVIVACHENPGPCKLKVKPKTTPDCGHPMMVECREAETINADELAQLCQFSCKGRFDQEGECGHECSKKCSDCFQGRFHERCQEDCGAVLICGHSCTTPCNKACPPCRFGCFNSCEHTKCKYECGVPCDRDCQQPCPYACSHSQCSRKCSEVCDKMLCTEPCPEILACGHACIGFCGERCPPYCRICSPEKLLQGSSFTGEVGVNGRFIFLESCGHCIESESMETWVNTKNDQILPLRCPICLTKLNWIRRYSATMNANFKEVNSVRKKVFGNYDEIKEILAEVQAKVKAHLEEAEDNPWFTECLMKIQMELALPIYALPHPDAQFPLSKSVHINKAKFLNWITNEWINASKTVVSFKAFLSETDFALFLLYWREYILDMASSRYWPLHPNEIRALEVERGRLADVCTLYARFNDKSERARSLMNGSEAKRLFTMAEKVLLQNKPYTPEDRNRFLQHLTELDGVTNCTISLTDSERQGIVDAFGGASGRWFKCANGHVYVVTECGGVTETGTCNECGALIGGRDHVVLTGNYLASEMDNAEQPLYPTALNRDE